MDIHKPKPWHGLREFLKEYVIIVVGVLTALGAEQIAETFHTRHLIAEAEDAMRSELVGDDLLQTYVRIAVAPCLATDLRRLRQAVADRVPAENFAPLAAAYNPPVRTWDLSAWTSTLSSAAGSRMKSDQLLAWSQDYVLVPGLEAAEMQEVDALRRLQRTRFRSGGWSPQRADELNDAIDDLELANQLLTRRAAGLAVFAAKDGMAVAPADRAKLLKEAREGYGPCAVEPNPYALRGALGQVLTQKDTQGVDRAFGIERK